MNRSSLVPVQMKTLAERSLSRIHRNNLEPEQTRMLAERSLSTNLHSSLALGRRKSKRIRSNLEQAQTKRLLRPS
jgi:hypothetical protein